ncbi:branched-chain amino acid ABC transporter permease, partial [bacterium]
MSNVHHCGDFRQTYKEDMRILQTRFIRICIFSLLVFLCVFPILSKNSPYLISLANTIGIAIVGALGINIVTGFTGQISLGQGAFLGVGAFSCAYLQSRYSMPFLLAMPCAGMITAAVGMVFGIPSLRLKGLYLAIATLSAQFILEYLFLHLEQFTGGSNGVQFANPAVGGFEFDTDLKKFYLIYAVVVLAVLFATNLFRSRDGRAFIAVRDPYLSAEIMGINLFYYRLLSFAISSFYAGIAG